MVLDEEVVSRRYLQEEMRSLREELQALREDVHQQYRVVRLGLFTLAERLRRLENRSSLSREDIHEELERYFSSRRQAKEMLVGWGIPGAILGLLLGLWNLLERMGS